MSAKIRGEMTFNLDQFHLDFTLHLKKKLLEIQNYGKIATFKPSLSFLIPENELIMPKADSFPTRQHLEYWSSVQNLKPLLHLTLKFMSKDLFNVLFCFCFSLHCQTMYLDMSLKIYSFFTSLDKYFTFVINVCILQVILASLLDGAVPEVPLLQC